MARAYNISVFTIGTIYIDIGFKTLMGNVKYELYIKLNHTNEDDRIT